MIDYTLPLDQLPDPLPIAPLSKPFDVTITPPGSKSITCRAYVLAALAEGESKIVRPLRADDTDHLLKALCMLGAEARWEGEDVYIRGVGGRFPRGGNLYMGEGGTPTRFMIACACLAAEPVTIDASPRMRERPIAEGVDMLRQLGAKIEYVEEEGRLPVRVAPSDSFQGGKIEIGSTLSSQFISALMLIAPTLKTGLTLHFRGGPTSMPYLNLTRRILLDWGVMRERRDRLRHDHAMRRQYFDEFVEIRRQQIDPTLLVARNYEIEADASSAVYWWLAALIIPQARVRVDGLSALSAQPDYALLQVFTSNSKDKPESKWTRVVGVSKRSALMNANASVAPDGAMALAVYAATANDDMWYPAKGSRRLLQQAGIAGMQRGLVSRISGLQTLRVKETDRIAALANELRKVGCTVETGEDWISITPYAASDERSEEDADRGAGTSGSSSLRSSDPASTRLHDPVIIETYNDHRMAMAFAVLGLARPGISIRNPACVAKSYPGFWKDFAKLYQ